MSTTVQKKKYKVLSEKWLIFHHLAIENGITEGYAYPNT